MKKFENLNVISGAASNDCVIYLCRRADRIKTRSTRDTTQHQEKSKMP